MLFFFFKQKTAYEMRISDWSSDVCSSDLDLDAAIWTIPGEKMKMGRAHKVPLSRQVRALLDELRPISGNSKLLFPSVRSNDRAISDKTVNAALRRLGYDKTEMTGHGFRAMASSLLNESRQWHPDAIERQMAHVESNDVRRAYLRSEETTVKHK